MQRFALFVDGSNLFGSLKAMNVEVDDYEAFFKYLYKEAVSLWAAATLTPPAEPTQLRRVYWYVVGSMDQWDLTLPQAQTALRRAFDEDKDVKAAWLATTGKANQQLHGKELSDRAWADCFADFKKWYEAKQHILSGMKRFHQSIRMSTDLLDVIESGHWKVNFIRKWVDEKGLDTSLAVHMIAYGDNYDVALVASGDADSIPSIRHMKNRSKHVGAVEFVNGSPPEAKGRNFSSRLKEHSDFVVRIYETELIRLQLARRPVPSAVGSAA